MSFSALRNVIPGSTADLVCDWFQEDGTLTDPDGQSTLLQKVVAPDGSTVSGTANQQTTREVTGRYFYGFTAPVDVEGNYRAFFLAYFGGRPEIVLLDIPVGDD